MAKAARSQTRSSLRGMRSIPQGRQGQAIADHLNHELETKDTTEEITREQVYRFLDVARDARYFWLRPPLEVHLRQRLADRYRLDGRHISVVPVRGASTLNQVALEAAWLTLDLIKDVARHKASQAGRDRSPSRCTSAWAPASPRAPWSSTSSGCCAQRSGARPSLSTL